MPNWEKIAGGTGGHSHSNKAALDKYGEDAGQPTFNGTIIGAAGGGTSSPTKMIVGGNVKFDVDFTAKTITFSPFNMWTPTVAVTLSAGSKSFAELGNGTFYYVCYNANTIELITTAAISTYSGYPVFGVMGTSIFPFTYPLNLIGVRGGAVYQRSDLSIGEWTLIGDSLTQGNSWWTAVREQFRIPIVTNLAVSGRRMAAAGGMWTDKDTVTATTDFCTIMGGTNDQASIIDANGTPNASAGTLQPIGGTFDTNTYFGAYQTLIEGLLVKNPKMRIILMTPPRAWTDTTGTTLRANLKVVGDLVKQIGMQYNLPVLDMYQLMGYNETNQKTYLTDGLHWTADGQRRVAALVCGAIRQYVG